MNLIVLPADDDGDWHADAKLCVEPDGTITLHLLRERRGDGVELDTRSDQSEHPQAYRQ